MKKVLFLLIIFLIMSTRMEAQTGGLTAIAYSTGQPVWETADYIDEFSWRGAALEYKYFYSERLAYGMQLGWSNFGQRLDGVVSFDQGAVSGTQIRKLGALPILLSINYFTTDLYADISPYLALNVGAYYMIEQFSMGIYGFDKSAWHFGLAPEFGVYVPVGEGHMQIAMKFNKAFAAGDYLGGGSKEFSWLSLNLGYALAIF
ncbi:hypothetical protein JW998_03945 [candidate division KSB1 bacterium]|nr:hypothetical protein [candidate division KSB1 bacterium]